MRVFQSTYKDRQGRRRESTNWYVELKDHRGRRLRMPAFTDHRASVELRRRLVQLVELASVGEARFLGVLVSSFGLMALLLATLGVYALVSHTVTLRAREMGIRSALGAKPQEIIREVSLRSLGAAGLGIGVGMVLSYWAVQWLQSLLFGLSPRDIPTFFAAATLLAVSAMLASVLPAIRATRLDPVKVLADG